MDNEDEINFEDIKEAFEQGDNHTAKVELTINQWDEVCVALARYVKSMAGTPYFASRADAMASLAAIDKACADSLGKPTTSLDDLLGLCED